ncbi:sensor histidine kinase [Saccharopolyspora gregorii]|uniref:histidine kinase n=1 Tax=Saccharopolyspora gregorii TaxID=33914 RepID=A0ABP6RQM8_9PSEU
MSRRPMRFARQVLALQIGLVVLITGVGFAVAATLLDRSLVDQYGQRALGVARSVAADDDLAAAVADPARHPRVATKAERVRDATGALFIVVTDDRGVRLAHPDPEQIGDPVSTDPQALAGREVVDVQRGTLGWSARGKVPLRTTDGRIVGQVSVGFDARQIHTTFLRLLGTSAAVAAGALLLGVAGSALLTRLLKRRTLGLEPHELTELVRQREAVLYGIGEGVLAVDADDRVTFRNAETERLLGHAVEPGTPVGELDLPPRLRAALLDHRAVDNLITVTADRVLVAHHRPVRRDGTDLGGVVTLRDRTDLDKLTRELESVRGTADVLRAQRHEFTNRLHALSGLLQTGHRQEAEDYLHALFQGSIAGLGPAADAVRDSHLVSFLGAKKAAAAEKEVALELGETSWVATAVTAPVEVTTVLGNLVDNACDAARAGAARPARVDVDLLSDGSTLHLSVLDTGDGVPAALRAEVFTEGSTSKDGEGHGIGLALARQAARALGGEVRLADPGGGAHGALFVARLPGALAEPAEPAESAESAESAETTEQEANR